MLKREKFSQKHRQTMVSDTWKTKHSPSQLVSPFLGIQLLFPLESTSFSSFQCILPTTANNGPLTATWAARLGAWRPPEWPSTAAPWRGRRASRSSRPARGREALPVPEVPHPQWVLFGASGSKRLGFPPERKRGQPKVTTPTTAHATHALKIPQRRGLVINESVCMSIFPR